MTRLDPVALFQRIASDVPRELHDNLFVTGSLAAAYSFQAALEGRGVNTKDADLLVHPAGNVVSCQQMTERLLAIGWTRTDECYAKPSPEPYDDLRAIRLFPPDSHDYFIEFLNLPARDQKAAKCWIPIRLPDGWYGLPSFRFMGLTSLDRQRASMGLEYASPPMMALANLLSHPQVGTERIQSGTMKDTLRSAKDLGRVLALAWLAGREETTRWLGLWQTGLQQCFPDDWRELARNSGRGLQELLADAAALEEARRTTDLGLLNGKGVTSEMLRITGERLLQDLIEPLNLEAEGK
jgi:hypothetical protein